MTKKLNPDFYYQWHEPFESVVHFFKATLLQVGWGEDNTKEVVMDVGCGPGETTTQLILPLFPSLKKVIAIDKLHDRIALACAQNFHPAIQFSVADIEEGIFLRSNSGNSKNPKWSFYFQGFEEYTPDTHQKEVTNSYSSDHDFKSFFLSICPLTPHIPDHRKSEFEEDFFQELLKLDDNRIQGTARRFGLNHSSMELIKGKATIKKEVHHHSQDVQLATDKEV
ncbi:hypothetical protein CEXT_751391 [Caerostris extrusa]|uniref:Methyltransferase domain-containing protein n=1 Tax=Caerostris extrusa TaxID=172846 RepID=A0AAV4W3L2_CAEEX|nr:hypothetical protein CEXT_751391 [Caerostris extrusa]